MTDNYRKPKHGKDNEEEAPRDRSLCARGAEEHLDG